MKILLILIAVFFSGCNIQFGGGSKYSNNGAISSNLPVATMKYRDDLSDSLKIRYKGEQFTVALPKSKIRFSVVCKTPEDVILKSFDNKKILIFVLKTKTWSELKDAP